MEGIQDISKRLFFEVCAGRLEIVRQLINSYGLSYSNNWLEEYTLLNCALRNNHVEVAKLLLVSGPKVKNISLMNTTTPPHLAVTNSGIEMVKLLLDKGAFVDAKDRIGKTPIFYAIENADVKLTKLLLSYGANIKENPQLLFNAVQTNCLEIVEALVHYDIDINAFDVCGRTALHFIVLNDLRRNFSSFLSTAYNFINIKAEIARLLLNKGANVNARTSTDLTTLHAATEAGFLQVVEALLEYDADINACDVRGMTALHYIAGKGSQRPFTDDDDEVIDIDVQAKIAKLLLSNGANVNAKTKNGLTALHIATQSRCQKVIEILLQYNADTNIRDITGRTALHFSAISEINTPSLYWFIDDSEHKIRGEIAKLLLNNGANVDAKTRSSETSLHFAAENGFLKVIEALLKYNADINAIDECGRTALYFTALNNFWGDFNTYLSTAYNFINIKAEIARLLLSKGANVNAKTYRHLTTLHAATEAGFLQVVEVLLEYDADINVCDLDGMTALHYNVVKRSLRPVRDNDIDIETTITKLLLRKGANVNAKTNAGLTALHIATEAGFLQIVEVLLEYDADVNVFDRNGKTVLHYAAGKGSQRPFTDDNDDDEVIDIDVQAKIAKLLLCNGANVDAKTKDGVTALHAATARGNTKTVETLLEHNANVNCRSPNGFTPLHLAAQTGFQEIINIILKYGADVNSVDKYNRTALYIASVDNRPNMVTTLLDHGTKFNFISVHSEIYLVSDLDESKYANIDPFDFEEDPFYYLYPKSYFLNEHILDVYKREVIKLEAANLCVSERIVKLLSSDDMTKYKTECEKEIANMKFEKIYNSNISFYDVLVKDSTLLAKCMRNEKIVQVLKSKKYKTKFPEYAERITCNFKKAMGRKELQEKGTEIFCVHFNNIPQLPYDCIEKIVSYLNYEDIKTLFNACKHNQEIPWTLTRSSNV